MVERMYFIHRAVIIARHVQNPHVQVLKFFWDYYTQFDPRDENSMVHHFVTGLPQGKLT